jgi:hypothetical protein
MGCVWFDLIVALLASDCQNASGLTQAGQELRLTSDNEPGDSRPVLLSFVYSTGPP